MEAASQPVPQGSNSNSRTGTPRGRGRGRFRKTPQTENPPTSKPSSNVSNIFSETKHSVDPHLAEKASHGHFDNPEPTKSSTTESPRSVRQGSGTSTPFRENGATSDKENSCSPKTQRTRRAVFDPNVMSRITSHLQRGLDEFAEAHQTGSLDILNKWISDPFNTASIHVSRIVSSDLKIQIPGRSHAATPQEKLIAEGRPRSMTDPVSPPSTGGWNDLLCTTQAASSKELSAPSPLSATKPRGRGRARGRARRTHQDMEVTSRPGGAPEHGSKPDLSQNRNHEQFSDAVTSVTGPSGDVHATKGDSSVSRGANKPASSSSEGGSDGALHSASAQGGDSVTSDGSRPSSGGGENSPTSGAVGGSGSESSAGGRSGKGLTLVIGKNSEQTPVTEQDIESPDDITLLLSPNHQYTLDWAAAMATPPASADSAPDWNTTRHF